MFSIFKLFKRRESALRETVKHCGRDTSSRRDMHSNERKRIVGLLNEDERGGEHCSSCRDCDDDSLTSPVLIDETDEIIFYLRPTSFSFLRKKDSGDIFVECWEFWILREAGKGNACKVRDPHGELMTFVKLDWLAAKCNNKVSLDVVRDDIAEVIKEFSI